jgi:hypothetical protein
MLVQHTQNVVVGSMIQLTDFWLLAMFVRQVLAKLFVKPCQHIVLDRLDSHHTWGAIMEGRCGQEVAYDLVSLGTFEVNGFQSEAGTVRRLTFMPTPTWVGVAEVLPSAVVRDPFGTFLLW